ncbi:hypothetical protein Syun_003414 [Stephania yunnanensis]|uniref:Myb/SANT-like domain-containing protein n=1 Tax=Stephania yunnanensis TaxID=152371 RepID=A0AAP0L2S0_9MAGN
MSRGVHPFVQRGALTWSSQSGCDTWRRVSKKQQSANVAVTSQRRWQTWTYQKLTRGADPDLQPIGYLHMAECSREDSHGDSADNSKTSRRKWSHAEDVALVNVMVEMVASGVYKCDDGFKPGYSTKVEEALNTTCPNSGIKARPHIESRLKSLKKDWFIVNDMICDIRHGTSGFGFYSTSNMVTAPEDVWEDYLKYHWLRNYPKARPWRLKSFPHYENYCIIFRNDRATGEEARAPDDAFEDVNDVHDSSSTSEPLTVPIEEFDATPTSSRTRTTTADGRGNEAKKKRKVSNDVYIGDQMVAAAQIVANEISKVTSAIRVEHDLRESFINAMAEVHELTDVERAIYGSKIMGRVELMAAFMTLQPESRLPWLHAMFN